MKSLKTKLTKTSVEAAQPAAEEYFIRDTELIGFALKVYPSGTKTFLFLYRSPEGITKTYKVGRLSVSLTTDQARKIAKDKAHEVHEGGNPAVEKQARREALTVAELLDAYQESERFKGNAESTRATDKGRIVRHLIPLLGREFTDQLTAETIMKAHRAIKEGRTAVRIKTKKRGLAKVTGGSGTADKSVILLSACYSWAVKEKLAKANPCAGMSFAPSEVRDTVLKVAADYARLFATLKLMEDETRIRPAVADVIRFIALTGARKSEATKLRWEWVDLSTGMVTLPRHAHKSGHRTGKSRVIALPAEAVAIVSRQPRGLGAEYVFAATKGSGPIALDKVWPLVRAEAKLPAKLGLHGLRHSIGTALAFDGASQVELMTTLGHAQISTTLRYIHAADEQRKALATRAAGTAMAGMAASKGEVAGAGAAPPAKLGGAHDGGRT